jgi:hypothetical protein
MHQRLHECYLAKSFLASQQGHQVGVVSVKDLEIPNGEVRKERCTMSGRLYLKMWDGTLRATGLHTDSSSGKIALF